ncbi:uncharacterized protein MELLADRAFT_115155 [Melampsora larici-populina 98AG31]|uniref:Uncharacterized protein n=1 Tax=Melampsora larici-populina (strain 98AG31 / pathotype 3-4-7) TaxID=747676 RepID=F4R5X2_MELLP|nr:uncharacterized protein MELLADRAFT_115155 [Melampsora larici-populina 98AG31]EGG12178.1 hypothetical protein MELLADRAFT_115155 [Melampsora larici-populina 98AG31]
MAYRASQLRLPAEITNAGPIEDEDSLWDLNRLFLNRSNLINLIQPNTHCLQIIITVLFNSCFDYVPAHIAYIEVGPIKPLSYFVELTGESHFDIPLLSIRLLDELSSTTDDAKQMIPNDILQGPLSAFITHFFYSIK